MEENVMRLAGLLSDISFHGYLYTIFPMSWMF